MGFWGALGKIAQGKPVFEVQDTPSQSQDSAPTSEESATHPWIDENGQKIIPHITMTHCKSVIDDNHMEVTAWVTNTSQLEVELDKIVVLNLKTELDRRLRPAEARQVVLYRGPLAKNDYVHKANLYYKIVQNGDYFRADYMVEYNRESNGTYTVEELHPERDVHDI